MCCGTARSFSVQRASRHELCLKKLDEPFSLFSDRIYAVNLLPWLSRSFIELGNKPLSPLLLQASNLIRGRNDPVYIHVRSHSPLPGPTSQGNSLADRVASTGTFMASTEQADQFHSLTHTNLKGLHSRFPHILVKQLHRI